MGKSGIEHVWELILLMRGLFEWSLRSPALTSSHAGKPIQKEIFPRHLPTVRWRRRCHRHGSQPETGSVRLGLLISSWSTDHHQRRRWRPAENESDGLDMLFCLVQVGSRWGTARRFNVAIVSAISTTASRVAAPIFTASANHGC